ncbi:MAG: DUF6069 family protein [Chloroflexota bacterium]
MSIRRFSRKQRRRTRVLAVVAAVLAAEALWLVSEVVFGVHLQAPAGNGYPQPVAIAAGTVAIASGVLSLLGWGLLAGLERFTSRARGIWLGIALLALIGSLFMPLSGAGVTAANRAVLVLMHVVVAAIVIPALYRTSPRAERPAGQPARVVIGVAA